MAKAKSTVTSTGAFREKAKKKRKGIHAKKKRSSHKHGKHYKKAYRGQGR